MSTKQSKITLKDILGETFLMEDLFLVPEVNLDENDDYKRKSLERVAEKILSDSPSSKALVTVFNVPSVGKKYLVFYVPSEDIFDYRTILENDIKHASFVSFGNISFGVYAISEYYSVSEVHKTSFESALERAQIEGRAPSFIVIFNDTEDENIRKKVSKLRRLFKVGTSFVVGSLGVEKINGMKTASVLKGVFPGA
jgi:hypothetical protein